MPPFPRALLGLPRVGVHFVPFGLWFSEDKQRTNMTSPKSFQQLTMEKEQALADLNTAERFIFDLFRRYENLKAMLEGFMKVGVLPPCLLGGRVVS